MSIQNDMDDLTCLSKQGFSLAIHKLDIDPKLAGTIHLNTIFRVSSLLSRSKQYGVILPTEVYFLVQIRFGSLTAQLQVMRCYIYKYIT